MRLRRIELDQVRKFETPVVVDGLGDGLNLIVGANEAGKTTVLDALNAGLFLKHGSRRARDLQHHRNETAPRIVLEIEIGGERLRFEKRFLQRAQAVLQVGGTRLTGDAAEQAFQERLTGQETGAPWAPGIWDLLLVAQGQSLQHAVAPDARGMLQASLEAQLDSVTGGGTVKEIIARLDDSLFGPDGLLDRRNRRPKGRFGELDRELAGVDQHLDDLQRRRTQLADRLARLTTLLEQQARETGPAEGLAADIRRLESEETRLVHQAEAATRAARAALARDRAERAHATRRALIGQRAEAGRDLATLNAAVAESEATLEALRTAGEELATRFSRDDALVRAAETWLGAVEDAKRIRAAASAVASEVTFDLDAPARGRLRLNGSAPGGRRFRVKVIDRLTVEVAGIGRIEIRPAQAAGFGPALRSLEQRAAAARAAIEQAGGCPTLDVSDPAACAATLERLREGRAETGRRLEDARAAYRDARADAGRATRERDRAQSRLDELERDLATARAGVADEALEAAALAAAERPPLASPETEPLEPATLEAVRDRLRTLRAELETARQRQAGIEVEIARLSTHIAAMQGQGLSEEIEERLRRRSYLAGERAAFARDVEVRSLLRDTLAEAELEVRETYTAPLLRKLQPALDLLLPGAEVGVDENLQIDAVIRRGQGREAYQQLSHGTREQLAVVARLAFAEVLVEAGRPCFVVLDDALVFSDDDRLERMFRILERAARKVQILVFTCRAQAFRPLQAKRLRIEAVEPVASA